MQTFFRATLRSGAISSRPRRLAPIPTTCGRQFMRTIVTKKYTAEHEAVVFDDATGLGIVSITEYAQSSLGDVVFVELPSVGTTITQGDQIGAVESVKAASDIYAPVSGTIEEINEILSDEPGWLNKSPEDKGWLCKIRLSDPSEMNELLSEETYKATFES
ncbi:glycine cleavage H-protein-domain-containing protein [Amanita rubescens]|nr:glycine cleavage H-protein-domain-containing protein [Amanita rubescens]